jgi:ubiquinone/menaquinone biosynthesis C-methylase UbiE
MKRLVKDELLDDDLGTPEEIAHSLVDLRHINDWFGGTRATIEQLRRIARSSGRRNLSLLEVGAGAGDVPLRAKSILQRKGITLQVALLDRVHGHLPSNGENAIVGDALQLPFGDNAFDVVSCSLLAHHFDPEVLQRFATECLRVSAQAVLINDLIRSRLHLVLVYCGLPLFRSRITWHDAPASVQRSYTKREMHQMLKQTSARRIEISSHYLYRMSAVLWK